MKKAITFTTGLSLQILILGLIGFFGTFLSDYLMSIEWFGDYYGNNVWNYNLKKYVPDTELYYGVRHIWYIITLALLTCIQIARIVMWSIAFWDEETKKLMS